MKRLLSFWLVLSLLGVSGAARAEPLRDGELKISAPSAVLMEKETGELLYEKGAHERRPPASVTKVMTLLLIVEDIESGKIALEDVVTASARAATRCSNASPWSRPTTAPWRWPSICAAARRSSSSA